MQILKKKKKNEKLKEIKMTICKSINIFYVYNNIL